MTSAFLKITICKVAMHILVIIGNSEKTWQFQTRRDSFHRTRIMSSTCQQNAYSIYQFSPFLTFSVFVVDIVKPSKFSNPSNCFLKATRLKKA